MDQPLASHTTSFINRPESCNLTQHVSSPTHINDYLLDLVITRFSFNIISCVDVFDSTESDHSLVTCTLDLSKPQSTKIVYIQED